VAPSTAGGQEACPALRTAELIQGKWTLLLLRDLARGINRFSTLQRSLAGISPKTLAERLRSLQEAGILTRTSYPEVPPRVEYALTARGQELLLLIEHMGEYGAKRLAAGDVAPGSMPGHTHRGG